VASNSCRVVALLAMLNAVEAGHQAALMAPTEILARQHLETIAPLAAAAGLEVAVVTGREKGRARATVLERLADGSLHMVIGTHALFQDEVAFADLALAVVDEQHKFGVHQRLQLSAKGRAVDVLVMTATPIPRTLTLTAYGDMDVSRLDEKPPGRRPIVTRTIASERLEEVVDAVARKARDGERVYGLSNRCRHQGGPLGEGRIVDGCVTCPWHGFQYRPQDGVSPPPYTERVATYRTQVVDGIVYLHPDPLPLAEPTP
jgi:RecG-like helicase